MRLFSWEVASLEDDSNQPEGERMEEWEECESMDRGGGKKRGRRG